MSQCDPTHDQNAESQRNLHEQLLRLRTLVDAAFEGIGISRQGIIVDVNEQLALMVGYERTELIGEPVAKIIAPKSRDLVRRAIESGRTDAYEHLAIRKDGTVFPMEVRGANARNGSGASSVDCGARYQRAQKCGAGVARK